MDAMFGLNPGKYHVFVNCRVVVLPMKNHTPQIRWLQGLMIEADSEKQRVKWKQQHALDFQDSADVFASLQ